MILRHVGFVIFRISKRAFPAYARRFGEDILSQAIFILHHKIQTYNLRYYDKEGQTAIDRAVSLIQPIFIIVMGILVGGVVAIIITSMYGMYTNVG